MTPHSFESILESLPQGIVLLDSANRVTAFNSRTLDILGLPAGAIGRGMNIDGLPGTAEVEIERSSPAALILRSAGRMLAAPRAAFAVPVAEAQ